MKLISRTLLKVKLDKSIFYVCLMKNIHKNTLHLSIILFMIKLQNIAFIKDYFNRTYN